MLHRTREGKVFLLAELENGHLMNIINQKLESFELAKAILNDTRKKSRFDEALYGEVMNEESASDFVADFDGKVSPYIVEALIRGLDANSQITKYRELIGRSSKIKISYAQKQKLIAEAHGEEDFYEQE